MNLSFVLLLTFGFPLSMFFTSMVWRHAPLLKNLVQSWVSTLILPTIGEDFANLAHDLLGISLPVAQQWCTLDHLDIHTVFAYFSRLVVLVTSRKRSHYLNAFYLYLFARYCLVHEAYQVDLRMCLVVKNLDKGNPVGMILAETLNSLYAVHREEVTFFVGSPLLLYMQSLIFA